MRSWVSEGAYYPKGRTEVSQSYAYSHQRNPCNFNLWTTRRVPSQNWQIFETTGKKLSLRGSDYPNTERMFANPMILGPVRIIRISGEPPTVPCQNWRTISAYVKKLIRGGKNIQTQITITIRSCPILRCAIQSSFNPTLNLRLRRSNHICTRI